MNEPAVATEPVEPIEPPVIEPVVEPAEPVEPPDPPVEESESVEERPRNRAEERIHELTAERNLERKALSEYGEYWRRKALENIAPPPPPAEDKMPEPDAYDTTGAYLKAHAQWSLREIDRRAESKAVAVVESREQRQQRTQAETSWQSKIAEFAKTKPDAIAVIGNPTFTQSQIMAEVIQSSPKGADLAYYLGTNPVENERIKRLPAAMQAAELGRLEAKLSTSAPTAKPKAQLSRAPEPPTPLGGGGNPTIDLETCSLDEYLEHRLSSRKRK